MIYLKSKPAVLLERAFRHLGAAARTTHRTANFAVGEHVDVQNVQNVQNVQIVLQLVSSAILLFVSFARFGESPTSSPRPLSAYSLLRQGSRNGAPGAPHS